jgi:hypothetical protein
MTKLTLSVDEEVVKQAKRLAKENGGSVSAMFSRIVRSMAQPKKSVRRIGPIARELTGIITLPEGKTERDILVEALMEKHGLKP